MSVCIQNINYYKPREKITLNCLPLLAASNELLNIYLLAAKHIIYVQ